MRRPLSEREVDFPPVGGGLASATVTVAALEGSERVET